MGLVAGLRPEDPREIGPYRLLGKLGSGGMGHVFLGMSAGGRPIAVKVIREELADDPQFRRRFRREIAAARLVSGLFTALVVDADLDGAVPWLATAYVPGPSLTDAVRQHGPFPARTLLALAAGLAESLSAIHAAGVVHRDLKPSNVLLAEDGPRVIDFGISGAAEASALTGANLVIGSPGYMSPEQVLGQDVGPASDMFSLGAVLTFAGTAQGPFGSGSPAALADRLVNSPAGLGLLPIEVRALVGSCLAKHPSDRPTALELLAEVGAIQPARGWLSESIIYGSAGDQAADLLGSATAVNALAVAAAAAGPPAAAGSAGRHVRHRFSRPLASAGITGGLVAASAAVVFALTGAGPQPLGQNVQPQAGTVQSTPSSASHVSETPGAPPSKTPAAPVPNAYLTPSLSEFLTTSPPRTVLPTESASAARSPSPSKSAASSSSSAPASPTQSASPTPTQSASPTPTQSASPTPTDSTTPTPTPTDSSSPSSPSPTDSSSPSSPSPSDSGSGSPSATPSVSAS
jgi:serine/threonine protein kinase